MTAPNTIALVSKNPVDHLLIEQISKNLGAQFQIISTKEALHTLSTSGANFFLLWNVDPLIEKNAVEVKAAAELTNYLEKHRLWHRVFAISDYPLHQVIGTGNFHLYSKYLYRNSTLEATQVYSYIVHNLMLANPFETQAAGIDELQIQKTRITNSQRKKNVLSALGTILDHKTIPKRIATSINRAVDELILNAVFDAPIDIGGKRYKYHLERGSAFELNKKEEVEIEMISTMSFLQVSVTDYFGSLNKEVLVPLLSKNFQEIEEGSSSNRSTYGLGLYQIIKAGLSIQIILEPGKRTRVSLFIPWVVNVKELKQAFRFFCLKMK